MFYSKLYKKKTIIFKNDSHNKNLKFVVLIFFLPRPKNIAIYHYNTDLLNYKEFP